MRRRKKRYMAITILLICIILWSIYFVKYNFLQEDLLFFEFLNFRRQSDNALDIEKEHINEIGKTTNAKAVYFQVSYQNRKWGALNLAQTIDSKTLVYEKIAPGTSGRFDMILNSNENMQYQIEFESNNEKPTNLCFFTEEDEKRYTSLEALGETLKGSILKNEEKKLSIDWEWRYETTKEQDKIDTTEAKKIREYNFIIYVQGY